MENIIKIGNTYIKLSSIKEYHIVNREFIYRPMYKEISEPGFFSAVTKYEFIGMEPYAAIFYESEKNYYIGNEKVKNPKDIKKKNMFKKIIAEDEISCINVTGRIFYTNLNEIPVLIIKDHSEEESHNFRKNHNFLKTPLKGKLESIPALYIKANHEYIFYGNGIHLEDVEKSYEDLHKQLITFNPLLFSVKSVFNVAKKIVDEKVVPAGKDTIKKAKEIKDEAIEDHAIPFARKILKKEEIQTELILPETCVKVGSSFMKEEYYVFDNDSTKGRITTKRITKNEALSFYDVESVINNLHEQMKDNEGLIVVKNGQTKSQNKYIYYIQKVHIEELKNKYYLCMHIKIGTHIYSIRADYEEIGITGVRDSVGYELYRRANSEEPFTKDPYDINYKNGHLMNYSEKEEFDAMFETHPLTMLRQLVLEILDLN